jgi:hypothetical protein
MTRVLKLITERRGDDTRPKPRYVGEARIECAEDSLERGGKEGIGKEGKVQGN